MSNLFGVPKVNEMRCNVYHDEREIPNIWLYHGFLFIPDNNENEFLEKLHKARAASTWSSALHFHSLRNTNIENKLAELWTNLFCGDFYNKIYFYMLGIDKSKLGGSGVRPGN